MTSDTITDVRSSDAAADLSDRAGRFNDVAAGGAVVDVRLLVGAPFRGDRR
jgi:hypothetical protein